LRERESDVAVFHSPNSFENAEAWNSYMENVMQEIPEKEHQELKELIDEDFGWIT